MKNLRAPQPEALRELRRPRPFRAHWIPGLLAAVAAVAVGCRSSLAQIREGLAAEQGGAAAEEQLLRTAHRGPAVVAGESGPARFARKVDAAFDSERAAATVRFVDGFPPAPRNDRYGAGLARLAPEWRAAGYGEHERLE